MNILKKSAAFALSAVLLLTMLAPTALAEEVQVPVSGEIAATTPQETVAPTEPPKTGTAYVASTTGSGTITFSGTKTDFSDLQDMMAHVGDLKEFDYTAESWANLMAVLKKCGKVLQGSSQNTVNNAITELQTALEALVLMNYTVLQSALDKYEALLQENQLLHDTWVKLDEAVVLAREQFATGDQKAVDEAAAAVNALLAEREAYDVPTVETQVVTEVKEVEVLPTEDFCNISVHHVWPVLLAVSVGLNVLLIAALIFLFRHKSKSVDETPLVNYDIYDDMDDMM